MSAHWWIGFTHLWLLSAWDQLESICDHLKWVNIFTQDSEQDAIEADAVHESWSYWSIGSCSGTGEDIWEKYCHSRLLEEIKADANYEHIKKLWLLSVVVESK